MARFLSVLQVFVLPLALWLGSAPAAYAQETWTTLPAIATSDTTGEKPQSKVWFHGHTWWAVLPTNAVTPTGTWLFRLEPDNTWSAVLRVSSIKGKADTLEKGNLTHVLVAGPSSSVVVSLEYVAATNTYQMWSLRPTATSVYVGETGTIAVDSTNRMWLATESLTNVELYYSDSPYTSFTGPVYLATNTDGGDINAVVALPNNTIGVFWSNFALQRYGFRVHVDGADPNTWLDDETPAWSYHPNQEMADDHLNLAVASDGTLYAAVKAGHASSSVPLLYLLVRHPQPGGTGGTWDDLYGFSSNGTRPIVLVNEDIQKLRVFYSASGGIYMRESNRWPISFGPAELFLPNPPSSSLNDPTSTKQTWAGRLLVMAANGGTHGGLITTVPGLVGYWKMDEGSGTQLRDSSGWGNSGTFAGTPAWTPVQNGLALQFNGSTNGVVSDQANLNPATALSLAAWIKPNQLATQDIISRSTFGTADGYMLSLGSNGKAFVHFNQATSGDIYKLQSTTSYPTSGSTWMHVAATYDGSTMRLYINGVEENWTPGPAALAASALSVGIGGQANGSRRFRGDMDDVRIYNRALTPAEVVALANNGPVKADLLVTKSDSVTTVYSGLSQITYNIQVTNLGPSNVAAATVIDTVSSKLTGVTWTCTASPGSICSASGSGSINDPVSIEAGDSLNYTLTGTVSASATGTLTNTATIAAPGVNDPVPGNNSATDTDTIEQAVSPSISVQPANLTVTQPNAAAFSVTASGNPSVSYQWRRNGVAIPGAITSSYTLNPTNGAADNGAQYSVVVSNIAGSVTSSIATLTVNVTPSITTQPVSTTVVAPAAATFTVAASGTAPLSYQWRRNGVNIGGATSASYVLDPTAGSDSGAQFSVVVTNVAGSVTSAAATLTVNVTPSITTPPANVTVTEPNAAAFSVVAAGTTPLSYQWRRNGVAISGATSASYTLSPTSAAADNGAQYSVTVTNVAGSVTSAAGTLTVNVAPTITTQPTSTTVVAPASATFTVAASGTAPLSYQWQRNGVPISGATSATYVLNPTAGTDSGAQFTVVVSNVAGTVTSAIATLTVNVAPSITTQPANTTVTVPNAAGFSVVASGTAPLTYQWRRNGVNISGATSSSYTLTPTALSDSGAQFTVVVTNVAGSVTSAVAVLTVNSAPVAPTITTQPANTTVTEPGSATFSVVANGDAPLSYQWRRNGVNISGATSASYVLTPTAVSDSGAQFSVVVTNAVGSATSSNATLTVNGGGGGPIGPIFDVHFNTDADGFTYQDDLFRGTSKPNYASGAYIATGGFTGGALRTEIGGINSQNIQGMSGGWRRSFTLAAPAVLTLSFRHKLTEQPTYETDEYSQALVSLDGVLKGVSPNDYIAQVVGGGPTSTGWQLITLNLGTVAAGTHVLAVGGFNNQKTYPDEFVEMLFDDILLTDIVPLAPSITTQPSNLTVIAPAAATFTVAATGDAPLSYQWRRNGVNISGATSTSYTLNPTAVSDNGAQFSVVVTNNVGSVTSATATLTVNAAPVPPSITAQPANLTVTAPASAAFTVTATGDAPLSYQWRRGGVNIGGATSASYTLNPTAVSDSGAQFDVVVTNGAGSATSTIATLTVNPAPVPPSITTQPANVTVTAPAAANFSVVAAGDAPLSYQWRRNGVNIGGATAASYSLNPTAVSDSGAQFSVVVTNAAGTVTSATATLTVNAAPVPPSITTQPANANVTSPTAATFSVVASGTAPMGYQWRRNGVNISGATGTNYTLNPTTTADNGAQFDVVVSNGVGTATSSVATLTVSGGSGGGGGPIFDVHFNTNSDDFTYADDIFRGTNEPNYASGNYISTGGFTGGALRVAVGGLNSQNISNMSGGWHRSFTLAVPTSVTLTFRYKLTETAEYEEDEFSQMLVSMDGALLGIAPHDYIAQVVGGGPTTTGWQLVEMNLGTLSAGTHVLALGGYNNKKTYPDESSEILIDDVAVIDSAPTPPSITTQPANVTVTAPGSATFSVVAAGSGLSYQWRREGVNISGATSASYTLNPTSVSDSGAQFSVVVSNSGGAVSSASATLTVNPPPVPPSITTQPANVTVTAPNSASFSVVATGDAPLSYQWRRNGVNISGATNSSYTLNPTAVSDSGAQFDVVVTNAAGTATSSIATLTVNPAPVPPSITTQPSNVTVTEPAGAGFSVVATGDAPLSYQWRRNGVNISGATNASYTLNPTAVSDSGAQFDVVVTNGAGTATSNAATLTVNPAPVPPGITTHPTSVTVTAPTGVVFSVVATGDAPLSYQWRRNGVNIGGATSASYTLNPTAVSDSGAQFDVVVTNGAGTATSNAATLTVNPAPVPPSITTQPANATVTAPGAANFSVVATGDAPLSYQWRRNGVNIGGATSASYTLNPTAVSDSGAQFDVVVTNGAGTATSNAATLTVNPAPVPPSITTQPASATVTAPNAASFSVVATGDAPLSYQWRRNGVDIGGATSSSYTLTPTAVGDSGAQFTVFISNAAGSVTSAIATLTVNPAPVPPSITTQPANVTVDAPAAATFSVVATGDAPLGYQWKRNGVDIAGATSSSYTLNPTAVSDTGAQFTVVVSNAAGSVTSGIATLTVNQAPVAPSITTQPANATVTAPNAATFSVVATGDAPLGYQWRRNGVDIAGATSASYTLNPTSLGDAGAQFSVVVSNGVGSVTSATATLTVHVTPSITTQPANVTVTAPASATFTVVVSGTAPFAYQWRRNGANIGGATGASYVLNPTAGTDNGATFDVVVSNAAGSVTSTAATLTVNVAPSITTQPANVSVTAPAAATFSVVASGTSLTYQWRRNGVAIGGATNATYVLDPTAVTDSGATFDVVISNVAGTVTSSAATLTVQAGGTTTVLSANFDSSADGFAYADDLFKSTVQPMFATGTILTTAGFSGGGAQVMVGGINSSNTANMSGGWQRSFTLSAAGPVTLTFRYKLTVVSLRADRNAQALASVDGVQYGVPPNNYIYRYDGVTGGLNTNTGWQTVTINLGTLSAGTHNLALGAYLSRKSATIETAEIIVDDVQVTTQQ